MEDTKKKKEREKESQWCVAIDASLINTFEFLRQIFFFFFFLIDRSITNPSNDRLVISIVITIIINIIIIIIITIIIIIMDY